MPKQRGFGVTFSDSKLLEAALTHPSYRNEHPPRPLADFDRMEFFGDAILNYVVCCELIAKFPDANEGLLSRFRSTLVSRKILSRIAREIRLAQALKLGESLCKEKGAPQGKILADAYEALVAAVYEDQGLEAARTFIVKRMKPYLNPQRLLRLDPNPKSTLQELSQKLWKKIPSYSWKALGQGILVEVSIGKKYRFACKGLNRRELEEKAAHELLKKLRRQIKFVRPSLGSGRRGKG